MYLKPNAFDIVLEVIAALLLLFFWGIALGPFVSPESFTDRFDQICTVILAALSSQIIVRKYRNTRFYTRTTRINFLVKVTEENEERQYRLHGRFDRVMVIFILTIISASSCRGIIPLEILSDFFHEIGFAVWLFLFAIVTIFYYFRSWELR